MSTKLTLEQRYNLLMYTQLLHSKLNLYLSWKDFKSQLDFTSDERSKYDISIDENTHQFKCNDTSYTVEYPAFPPIILKEMKHYIDAFDTDKNSDNALAQKTINVFKTIVC